MLVAELQEQGVETSFKTKGKTEQVEGVVFTKDGTSFSGSHIDHSCSYSKLSARLEQNLIATKQEEKQAVPNPTLAVAEGFDAVVDELTDGLFDSTSPAVDVAELAFQRKLRNQANKKPKRRRL